MPKSKRPRKPHRPATTPRADMPVTINVYAEPTRLVVRLSRSTDHLNLVPAHAEALIARLQAGLETLRLQDAAARQPVQEVADGSPA